MSENNLINANQQAAHLQSLEVRVTDGLNAFMDAGRALLEIRDSEAFKVHCETFDEYLEKRWPQLGRSQAFGYIKSAKVRKLLEEQKVTNRDFLQNEFQYRQLAAIEDDDTIVKVAATAIQKAVAAGAEKLTAALIKQVADEITGTAKFKNPLPVAEGGPIEMDCPGCNGSGKVTGQPICVECSNRTGQQIKMRAGSSPGLLAYYYCTTQGCKNSKKMPRSRKESK